MTFSSLYKFITSSYFSLAIALAIFWIVVTIRCVFLSFICLTRTLVLSVVSTEPSTNLLNSLTVCESRSFLSTKKNTFFILGLDDKISATLKEVKVFPEPVVCQTYAFKLVSVALLTKASAA